MRPRARYGTGDLLNLNKRNIGIRIKLTPCGSDFTQVQTRIDGIVNDYFLSGVMGGQFSSFITALYCLYEEDDQQHSHYYRHSHVLSRSNYPDTKPDGTQLRRAEIFWDGEAYGYHRITLSRESKTFAPSAPDQPDPVTLVIHERKSKVYHLDGRDLCYAVARACTEALKKYGFKGFLKSSSGYYMGDTVDIEHLLFIKAYALGASEARETAQAWEHPRGWMEAYCSSFEKEMELLMFDM